MKVIKKISIYGSIIASLVVVILIIPVNFNQQDDVLDLKSHIKEKKISNILPAKQQIIKTQATTLSRSPSSIEKKELKMKMIGPFRVELSHDLLDVDILFENWKIIPDLVAYDKKESEEEAIERDEQLLRVGRFIILNQRNLSKITRNSKNQFQVVYDSDKKRIGFLTGSFSIGIVDGVFAKDISEDHELELVISYPEIRTAVIKKNTRQEFTDVLRKLERDERVRYVEPEIFFENMRKH